MKKVLITGANGFLAQRFMTYLNRHTSLEVETTTANTELVSSGTGSHYLDLKKMDVTDFSFLDNIDVVFHLASMNEIDCVYDLKDALEINGYASFKLYEEAANRGVKRFIYLSTAHVYGQQVGSISISSNVNPLHPYSISKYLGEQLIKSSKLDLDFVILRLSNAFGYPIQKETSRWKLLVNDLCKQAICDKKIQLNSSGQQYRNFVPICEVLPIFKHLIYADEIKWNETYNVSGFNTTVLAMAQKIAEISSQYLNANILVQTNVKTNQQSNFRKLNFQASKLGGFDEIAITLNSESTKKEVVQCLKKVEKFYN